MAGHTNFTKLNFAKKSVLTKLTYRFNEIAIKIPK